MPEAVAQTPDSAVMSAAAPSGVMSPQVKERMDRELRVREIALRRERMELDSALVAAGHGLELHVCPICSPVDVP